MDAARFMQDRHLRSRRSVDATYAARRRHGKYPQRKAFTKVERGAERADGAFDFARLFQSLALADSARLVSYRHGDQSGFLPLLRQTIRLAVRASCRPAALGLFLVLRIQFRVGNNSSSS